MDDGLYWFYRHGLRAIGAAAFAIAAMHILAMLNGLPSHVVGPTLVAEVICLWIGAICALPGWTPAWLARPNSPGVGSALAGGSLMLWFVLSTALGMAVINLGLGYAHADALRFFYQLSFLGVVSVGGAAALIGARAGD